MKVLVLSVSMFALAACTSQAKLNSFADEPFVEAKVIGEPEAPVKVVETPKVLPLPGQLKKLPGKKKGDAVEEIDDPLMRVDDANAQATKEPTKAGYVNAIQVYPYSAGALYRLYASVNQVSDIALQPGEKLVSVSTGDTVRWIVGDTTSGEGALAQVHILAKPIAADLSTNMVITTERRTYHLELQSTEMTSMSSLSWSYPADDLIAIRKKNEGLTGADGISIDDAQTFDNLNFHYRIVGRGDFAPARVFDDGAKVYIQFPSSLPQGEAPPLFVQSSGGKPALVNYRVKGNTYIVDRLFASAELRLGTKPQSVIRIIRTDAVQPRRRYLFSARGDK
ncbi:MAG: P-type conjugative transfer protein TrbG [Rhizobiales bacterium]|nr:P-type conjugative transfer protein TrbG [Hyphomicrobiales bacterium]